MQKIAQVLSLNKDASALNQWDFGILREILGDLDYKFVPCSFLQPENRDAEVVILPARHHVGLEQKVALELKGISGCRIDVFLMGDEEGLFDASIISPYCTNIYIQNPRPKVGLKFEKLGTGYPQHFHNERPTELPEKSLDYFFAGQSTFHKAIPQ
jgi:hypothetical protein